MTRALPEGLYELLVTEGVASALGGTEKTGLAVERDSLSRFEANELLARHVADELRRCLDSMGPGGEGEGGLARRIDLTNAVLAFAREHLGSPGAGEVGVAPEAEVLTAVHRGQVPPRTVHPLATSGLLTGASGEPRLGAELEAEIASADGIDALVSFVTWEGWRRLREAFGRFAQAGRPLRLLTTTYTGATEAAR